MSCAMNLWLIKNHVPEWMNKFNQIKYEANKTAETLSR